MRNGADLREGWGVINLRHCGALLLSLKRVSELALSSLLDPVPDQGREISREGLLLLGLETEVGFPLDREAGSILVLGLIARPDRPTVAGSRLSGAFERGAPSARLAFELGATSARPDMFDIGVLLLLKSPSVPGRSKGGRSCDVGITRL